MKKLIVPLLALLFFFNCSYSQTPFTAKEGLPKAFEFAQAKLNDNFNLVSIYSNEFNLISGFSYKWFYKFCSINDAYCIIITIDKWTSDSIYSNSELKTSNNDNFALDTNYVFSDSVYLKFRSYCYLYSSVIPDIYSFSMGQFIMYQNENKTLWYLKGYSYSDVYDSWKVIVDPKAQNCSNFTDVNEIISNNFHNDLFIKPNPASENINIYLNSNINNLINIKILNNLGVPVIEQRNIYKSEKNSLEINTSSLPPGIYFCNVSSVNFSETMKFVIIR